MTLKVKRLIPFVLILFGSMNSYASQTPAHASKNQQPMPEKDPRDATIAIEPYVKNGTGVFVSADFIYWQTHEDGLGYVRTGVNSTGITFLSPGHTHRVHDPFSPGFKLGVGYEPRHDGWDLFLEYTWLHSQSNQSSSLDPNSTDLFINTWDIGGPNAFNSSNPSNDGFTQASGYFALHFNNFDLELGREYYISSQLTFRPSFGLKGAWLTQQYHVQYSNFVNPMSELFDEVLGMKIKQIFWGLGIRAGIDSAWMFTKNWSLFGNIALTGLWGRFDIHRIDQEIDLPILTTDIVTTSDVFFTIKPVLELSLGLRYETWFVEDRHHVSVNVGWEEQIWVNQNQFFRLDEDTVNRGDLIFQGLTVHLRFDF